MYKGIFKIAFQKYCDNLKVIKLLSWMEIIIEEIDFFKIWHNKINNSNMVLLNVM